MRMPYHEEEDAQIEGGDRAFTVMSRLIYTCCAYRYRTTVPSAHMHPHHDISLL